MSTSVQRRRGTTAQHASFAGLNGEITVDTDKEVVVVHDGATAGGFPQMRENGSQNLVTTGSVTGGRFIPTSSTVPTNGVYLPAANSVAISTNGAQKLTINSAGRVILADSEGIQLAAKASSLYTVDGSLSCYGTNNGVYLNGAGASGWLQLQAAGTENNRTAINLFGSTSGSPDIITFRTANNERVRVTSAGLVGVGTSSPSSIIHAAGTGNIIGSFISSDASYAGVKFENSSRQYTLYVRPDTSNSLVLRDETGSAARITLDTSGRLGINTTSPGTLLDVNGIARATDFRIGASGYITDNGGNVVFNPTSGGSLAITSNSAFTNGNIVYNAGASGGVHVWQRNGSEAMRLDSSSRLLVGTSTSQNIPFPNGTSVPRQLQLDSFNYVGIGIVSNADAANGTRPATLTLSRTGSNSDRTTAVISADELGAIQFTGYSGGHLQAASILGVADTGTISGTSMPGRLVFSTCSDGSATPQERLRITSTGQVRLAGAGITFNGDTATANELDDYEEGTWTPAVFNDSGVNMTSDFIATQARYTKIGRVVHVMCFFYSDSAVTNLIKRIDGLPFIASSRGSGSFAVFGGGYANRTVSSASVFVDSSESSIRINNTISIATSQTNIAFSLTYSV